MSDAEGGDVGKRPAFQFYAADFIMGTRHMTLAEVGLYISLLAWSWDCGALPQDMASLARVAGGTEKEVRKHWQRVSEKWTLTDAGYINERLERQREELNAFIESRAAAGRRSGESRRTKREHNSNTVRTQGEQDTQRNRTLQSSVFDLQSSDHRVTTDQSHGPTRARADEPLVNGRSIRLHGQHAWCSLPREGLCVPAFLHREFLGKSQRPEPELRAWYAGVVARFDGQPVGEDALLFWRREFSAWIGVASTAAVIEKQGRAERVMSAAERVMAKQIETRKALASHGE